MPRFDSLNLALTVEQTLTTTVLLQRGNSSETALVVDELLDVLSLSDKRHSLVAALSSGERKRAAIGVGLVAQPRVLLLDEPTTGLDSATSSVLVNYIVYVTRRTGVICLMTLHQPSSALFSSLDDLLLLSKGRTTYFGPLADTAAYFTRHGLPSPADSNPADYYLDLMNDRPADMAELWKLEQAIRGAQAESKSAEDDLSAPPNRPSELRRLVILTGSRLVFFWQERVLYLYRLVELVLIAVFIGTLFLRLSLSINSINEIGGALFFKVWVVLFVAISGVPILVRDRLTFDNEYLNGTYSAATFCTATFLASLPYQLASALVFESIVWFLVGFNNTSGGPWIFGVASTFSLLLMMEGIALCTTQALKQAMLATTSSMVVLGILFLFPGFFVSTEHMVWPVRWLSYIVPTRYSLNSQLENIFNGQQYDGISGSAVLSEFFSVDHSYNQGVDWFIVMTYTLAFRMLHWAMLKWHYRQYGHGTSSSAGSGSGWCGGVTQNVTDFVYFPR